jgi:hypothetical protein
VITLENRRFGFALRIAAAAVTAGLLTAAVLVPPAVEASTAVRDGAWERDPGIPAPESVLGYPLGRRFTPHHRIVDYLKRLDASSDRVTVQTYGHTYEGRPLLLVTISDPRNLARRDTLRSAYQRLADPRTLTRREASALVRDLPIAVWLSFNIHGDEASSSEAAMALAHRLAADQGPDIRELLQSTVVLLDPCLNPDGRDRYVNWLSGVTGSAPDPLPASREHHEPWPGGRFNHYLFDLNRDWAWLTQAETRARAEIYLSWKPQVHVDFHEMWANSTYFFFPPERPIHPLLRDAVRKWGHIFGEGNAAAFDARGWRYYTGESFDLLYPGYGDSWPSLHGAIGMTYEQAGHGFAAVRLVRGADDTLTLAERAEHHTIAALATLETAAAHRVDKLLDFHRHFESQGQSGPRAYLFPPGNDPPRTAELMALLMAHGVEIDRAQAPIRASRLRAYDGRPAPSSLPAGTYVVSTDQPLHRFIHAVLEPETALPDTFFYDISAWSLPLAFGIEAYWTESEPKGSRERLQRTPQAAGAVVHPEAAYAFLVSWERNASARAAAWLLERGVKLHFATRRFETAGRSFPPGTLVVFRSGNRDDLSELIERAARTMGIEAFGVDTGLTDAGPDLGSFRIRPLRRPRVAVVSGPPASPTSVGACWFLFDHIYGVPHSLLTVDEISSRSLQEYSVLVLPDDGSGGIRYGAEIDSSTVAIIEEWISDGGVFVGLGGGAFFAAADRSGLSSVRTAAPPDETADLTEEERKAQEDARRRETLSQREERRRRAALPGTIFRITVDPLHPLGFGYTGEARVMKISTRALELGPAGTNVAWFTASPKVSGYASPANVQHLAERPFLIDEPRGRGHVVLYVEDPNFRLFWYGLNRLFLNSVFFLSDAGGD